MKLAKLRAAEGAEAIWLDAAKVRVAKGKTKAIDMEGAKAKAETLEEEITKVRAVKETNAFAMMVRGW